VDDPGHEHEAGHARATHGRSLSQDDPW